MKTGKYCRKSNGRLRWNKKPLLLVSVLALVICLVGGTIAYLTDTKGSITNTFTPGKVDIEVSEDTSGGVKNNVKIFNTNDSVNAYIRAKVIVTWQNDEGKIHPNKPVEDTDYKISWTKDGWNNKDANGWFTYKTAVAPGGSTGVLFTNCEPESGKAPSSDYFLVVDIISEAIQADGVDAAGNHPVEAWGVTVATDGSIS